MSGRIRLAQAHSTHHRTLSNDRLELSGDMFIGSAKVIHPNAVDRPDGVIHGIEQLLVPRSVQQEFNNRHSLRSISAVKPEGAREVDPRTHRLKKPAPPVLPGAPPVLPIYDAMAPGPSLAPAPAPGQGGPHHHFNGMRQVKDFIHTLIQYGEYNEMTDILVNLTSLATEMGRNSPVPAMSGRIRLGLAESGLRWPDRLGFGGGW